MVKSQSANEGDVGLIPGLERSFGKENGNPLQYSCLGNPVDRGAWRAIFHGLTRFGHKLVTTTILEMGKLRSERLSYLFNKLTAYRKYVGRSSLGT